MRVRRLILFLAALGLVSAGATASALASRTGSGPIQHAATKSSKASSVKFDFTISISGGGSSIPGGKITFAGSGAFDAKHKAADVKLDLSSLAPLLQGATGGGQVPKSIEVVVVGNVVYVNFPALAKAAGAPGKQWVKFDLGKLPKSVTKGVNPKAVSGVNPQQALSVLHSSLTVHKVGTDQYGTHYHATVKLSSFVALVPKSQQAAMKASLAKAGLTAIPFDAWVGKGGYVTRVTASIAVKGKAGQPPVKLAVAANLHDYNHPVHVSAPPASATVDGTKLISGLLGSVGGGG